MTKRELIDALWIYPLDAEIVIEDSHNHVSPLTKLTATADGLRVILTPENLAIGDRETAKARDA